MIAKSPSGALSPYYYKGGYFHGIHYGSYFDDANALLLMMEKEETFILKSPEKRRILIDLYETKLTKPLMEKLVEHIDALSPKIIRLAISAEKLKLYQIHNVLKKTVRLEKCQLYFCSDMEKGKTWLVGD